MINKEFIEKRIHFEKKIRQIDFLYFFSSFRFLFLNMRFLKFFNSVTHTRSQIVRFQSTKTVFALSSGHGTCGVAVIRLTGSNSGQALLQMTNQNKLPTARRAQLKKLIHPETKEILDHALTLWFPGQYCQILHSVKIMKIYSHDSLTKIS